MAELELVGSSEVAELLGISKQTLQNWRTRSTFPSPAAELRSGPVWKREEIIAWAKTERIQIVDEGKKLKPTVSKKRRAVVVSVVNMKGGVGKSTVTANLGWYCAYKRNHKVLLIDLDPQFNLSQYTLGIEKYEELLKKNKPTIYEIFEQTTLPPSHRKESRKLEEEVVTPVRAWGDGSRIDLIPSKLDFAWTLKSSYDKKEHLANFVEKLRTIYDLILIDCPPTQSMLTDAAYLSSDFILVPVKPEFLSTIGLPLLLKSIEDYKSQHRDHMIQIAGILFNAVSDAKNEHQKSKADVAKLARASDCYLFKNQISYSDSYPKGSREGRPIFLTGHARFEKVNEFDLLASEFLKRVGM